MKTMENDNVRIDKWLWAARFFKTRSLAADAVDRGRVRIGGEPIKPARKAIRQPASPFAAENRPPAMPLIPAMRPFRSTNAPAASPISAPPASACSGVKLLQSIMVLPLSRRLRRIVRTGPA